MADKTPTPPAPPPPRRLPWQQDQWDRLARFRALDRLPHALLLRGPAGVGKGPFAEALAKGLLCDAPEQDGSACGRCRGCTLFAAGSHPDLRRLEPGEQSRVIRIDQVRGMLDWVTRTSQYGGPKVVIVPGAERMNVYAANSLLKTLEEPPGHAVIMLLTPLPGALPITVRSRCQQLAFPPVPPAAARDWLAAELGPGADVEALLAVAAGAPLHARDLAAGDALARRAAMVDDLAGIAAGGKDPVAVAEAWAKQDLAQTLAWMQTWLHDMIRSRAADATPRAMEPALLPGVARIVGGTDLRVLYGHLDRVNRAVQGVGAGVNLNPQLVLEDLLIAWAA
jgi:DNA polymerase-3 subunit delta'